MHASVTLLIEERVCGHCVNFINAPLHRLFFLSVAHFCIRLHLLTRVLQIEKFDVVWNGGVRSTVDANVGFHIQSNAEDGQVDHFMMKRVLNLCQSHEDLHNKVVENTKHQLFDVIAQIEPLGYGSLSFEDEHTEGGMKRKTTTLQDLEQMFSSHVESILKK
jgi:hypothetical protein